MRNASSIPARAAARLLVALSVLAVHGPVPAQAGGRVDSTLPELDAPSRGARVLSTRPLREASEARLRMDLARQVELDRLVNPYRDTGPAWVQVVPPVRGPGVGPVVPPRPSPLPVPLPAPLPARHR